MSKTWSYEILLPRGLGLDELKWALIEAERRGYSPLTPGSGIARVFAVDGMDVREYAKPVEALEDLLVNGGGLQLWKGEIDILLGFQPAGRSGGDGTFDPSPPGWSWMRLSVDGSFFRHEPVRSTVAADLEEIFLGLCQRLHAAYGFAWDEETAEAFQDEVEKIPLRVAAREEPPLLFWKNYFDREHFPWLDEALFSRIGSWVTVFPLGMLVTLCDVPWEMELSALKAVNCRWLEP